MKAKKPLSYRCLVLSWSAILLITAAALLLALGYQTRGQALRESERIHALRPTEVVMQGNDGLHGGSNATDWVLSANEDAVLFGYYHKGIFENYSRIFSVALDYDDAVPYCADTYGMYSGGGADFHVFGAIKDPMVTEIYITTDSIYADVEKRDTYTLSTRDMVYQNGIYYFVLPVSPEENPYIANIVIVDRNGTRQEYSFDKPRDLPPEFLKAMQDAQ